MGHHGLLIYMRPPCLRGTGTPNLRNLMCLSRRLRLPSRTQRYIRTFVMSSSLLLTITESHGFRALMAAIITIIAAIRIVGRGLRNLACSKTPSTEPEAGPTFWDRLWQGRGTCAREVPVLWFDTSGGREGPHFRSLRPQPSRAFCYVSHSQVHPLADQLAADNRDWTGFQT
jgi:hypothetical protein